MKEELKNEWLKRIDNKARIYKDENNKTPKEVYIRSNILNEMIYAFGGRPTMISGLNIIELPNLADDILVR
jgi:hypothetical protein